MRIRAAEPAKQNICHNEDRPLFGTEAEAISAQPEQYGTHERLATVMRHNAAALLLNRALFEFQADYRVKAP